MSSDESNFTQLVDNQMEGGKQMRKSTRMVKNRTRGILVIGCILTFMSCSHRMSLSEEEKEIIQNNIGVTLQNYFTDIRKSGLTAELKYLDNSPEFFWVPPGYSSAISYDSVASILKQTAPKYKSIKNSFQTLRIVPLSKKLATYTGRLRSTMTDNSGKSNTFLLVETGVMVKRSNGWKLLHGQTSILKVDEN